MATTREQNSAKGDSTADEWVPPDPAYGCSYATVVITVKDRYALSVTPAEADALETCSPPAERAGHEDVVDVAPVEQELFAQHAFDDEAARGVQRLRPGVAAEHAQGEPAGTATGGLLDRRLDQAPSHPLPLRGGIDREAADIRTCRLDSWGVGVAQQHVPGHGTVQVRDQDVVRRPAREEVGVLGRRCAGRHLRRPRGQVQGDQAGCVGGHGGPDREHGHSLPGRPSCPGAASLCVRGPPGRRPGPPASAPSVAVEVISDE